MTALLSELPLEDEPIAMVQSDGVPVPRVNLLPPELLERRALSRLGRGLGAAVLATVLIGAGVGYLGGNGGNEAQGSLDSATAQNVRLQKQVNSLAPAATALAQAQSTQTSLRAALANEVLWSRYLDQLKLQLPHGVRYSSVQVAPVTSTGGVATGGSAPVALPRPVGGGLNASGGTSGSSNGAAIATITLNGVGESQNAVADLLQSLGSVPQFANVYLTSSTAGTTPGSQLVTFVITADVTGNALSHRYDVNGS